MQALRLAWRLPMKDLFQSATAELWARSECLLLEFPGSVYSLEPADSLEPVDSLEPLV